MTEIPDSITVMNKGLPPFNNSVMTIEPRTSLHCVCVAMDFNIQTAAQ